MSRHGGDEFLILLTDVYQPSDAALVAAKVSAALAAPNRIGRSCVSLEGQHRHRASTPAMARNPATLIDRADAAMYRAKRNGLGDFHFHHDKNPATRVALNPWHSNRCSSP